jgi:nitrogenase molybdenum-cofactor synthesis protein NifE
MAMNNMGTIAERDKSIVIKGKNKKQLQCDTDSSAGCVSQRACVYCGARVVLNPITDAIHLVHGPIGCASYTWDIRGSLSSVAELYRNSFSTDLKERDVIFGGEQKLTDAIDGLMGKYQAKLIFVYSTCIVGVIGDDLQAICSAASQKYNIEVIPVESSGFIGNKSAGYRAAADALLRLIKPAEGIMMEKTNSINYLGDFNLAGETWIIQNYLRQMGVEMNVTFTGDSNYEALKLAPKAKLNIIQCAGSMIYLAGKMEELYGIPYIQISFLGIEDTTASLRKIAAAVGDESTMAKAEELIRKETSRVEAIIKGYRQKLIGKKSRYLCWRGF